MSRRIAELERKIGRIQRELATLGDLRPGSLSEQYNVCGVEGCRCKASPANRHGPYYQLGFTRKGRSTTRFVRREDVRMVKAQLKNYAKLRELIDQWIEYGIELSALRIKERHQETAE